MSKLKTRDLMIIGVYAALYFICLGVGTLVSLLFAHGGNMMLSPAFTGLIAGGIYMLLIAKVKKFGAITLLSIMMSCFFFFSGHYVLSFLPSLVCGVIADFIAKGGRYESKGLNLVSYITFSFGNLSPIILMWIMREAYIQRLLDKGKDWAYIENVIVDFTVGNVVYLLVCVFIGALLGGLFGQSMMKKHFIKSGMVK